MLYDRMAYSLFERDHKNSHCADNAVCSKSL